MTTVGDVLYILLGQFPAERKNFFNTSAWNYICASRDVPYDRFIHDCESVTFVDLLLHEESISRPCIDALRKSLGYRRPS